jgi:hypothetical protein
MNSFNLVLNCFIIYNKLKIICLYLLNLFIILFFLLIINNFKNKRDNFFFVLK